MDTSLPTAPTVAAKINANYARHNAQRNVLAKYEEMRTPDWDGSTAPSIYDLCDYELQMPSQKWESRLDLDLGLDDE